MGMWWQSIGAGAQFCEVVGAQLHEVDLLFECVLIRDGQAALPCWFLRSDVQSIVNYICTM